MLHGIIISLAAVRDMPLKAVTSFQVEMTLEIMKRKSVFLKSAYFNILLKVEKDFQVQKCRVSKVFMLESMKMLRIQENSCARYCKRCDFRFKR